MAWLGVSCAVLMHLPMGFPIILNTLCLINGPSNILALHYIVSTLNPTKKKQNKRQVFTFFLYYYLLLVRENDNEYTSISYLVINKKFRLS